MHPLQDNIYNYIFIYKKYQRTDGLIKASKNIQKYKLQDLLRVFRGF